MGELGQQPHVVADRGEVHDGAALGSRAWAMDILRDESRGRRLAPGVGGMGIDAHRTIVAP
ncbi:hypothetical protein Kosp01_05310 [Kocuria sp. NBRC 114282]|nr:hypothetical protein Kosp01_05310 [Kocuria sp. NBRC 114282]